MAIAEVLPLTISRPTPPDGEQYPVDPPSTFTAEIGKGGAGSYGVSLDCSDGRHLIVYGITAGAVADYNKSVEPSKQLTKSDFIVSVNGKSSPADCIVQFQEEAKATCVVSHGFELSCTLERENLQTPLGLAFPAKVTKDGYGLPILDFSVTEGAAKEYNSKCAREWD